MRKLISFDLQPGMITAEPVFSQDGRQTLVPAGTKLTAQSIRQIQNWDIIYIMVAEENAAELLAPPPPPEKDPVLAILPEKMAQKTFKFASSLEEVLAKISESLEKVRASDAVDLGVCRTLAAKVAGDLVQPAEAINRLLFRLSSPKDRDFLERHLVSVAALAGMLATWLEMKPAVIEEITLAALLHDIGKLQMPRSLIIDSNPTRERREMLMQHIPMAKAMLQDVVGLPAAVLAGVLQHHECRDGSGYPLSLAGDKIHPYAKVIAVADRLCHIAAGAGGLNPFHMIATVKGEMFTKLDPAVGDTFIRRINDYLLNNPVKLNDGRKAKVVFLPTINPTSPVLETADGDFIDLTKNREVAIVGLTF